DYLCPAVLAINEVLDHAGLERARAVERNQSDDIFEYGWLQALYEAAHTGRFKLEYGGCIALLQQLESNPVIQRDLADIDGRFVPPFQPRSRRLHRIVDDSQRAQTQEVELDQTRSFDIVLVELRDQIGTTRFTVQRGEINQARW